MPAAARTTALLTAARARGRTRRSPAAATLAPPAARGGTTTSLSLLPRRLVLARPDAARRETGRGRPPRLPTVLTLLASTVGRLLGLPRQPQPTTETVSTCLEQTQQLQWWLRRLLLLPVMPLRMQPMELRWRLGQRDGRPSPRPLDSGHLAKQSELAAWARLSSRRTSRQESRSVLEHQLF